MYILCSKASHKTARKIADELGISSGKTLENVPDNEKVFCWGARKKYVEPYNERRVDFINSLDNIERSAKDKFTQLTFLKDYRINIPNLCLKRNVRESLNRGYLRYPIVGRKKYHKGGEGLYICLQKKDIEPYADDIHYFLNYIPTKKEYRVHIFNGRIIRVSTKRPTEDADNNWVETFNRGWKFIDLKPRYIENLDPRVKREAINTINTLGLLFGAVDIVVREGDEKPFVLEANTAPALSDKGLAIYIDVIKDYLVSRFI